MADNSLSGDLRSLAQHATEVMGRASKDTHLPEPMRGGIVDRVLQLRSLVCLLAYQIEASDGESSPPDADFDP